MSIAVLNQVYGEMRRLAIAGSSTAVGDFRLQKLIPPLEQAGAEAPVFARVAASVKAVVESNEQTASAALLDLAALVNAILFTQGETGVPGPITDLETTEMSAGASQASARVLKPLLEALTTTGSGRVELIRTAFERGDFNDLRLVKPALDALDDPYGEIAEFIADKVLPLYGKAILPELRARFDVKGRAGQPRRFRLLHRLDPAGTRDLVTRALEEGSKEVKVAAIECLGGDDANLSFLIEQSGAKAQDVRQAAYKALACSNDESAVAVLSKAISGKDLELAVPALAECRNAKVVGHIMKEAESGVAEVLTLKDKKAVNPLLLRIRLLLRCLQSRTETAVENLLLKLFEQRTRLEKIKGSSISGSDINEDVVELMANGSKKLKTQLAEAHASLSDLELHHAFSAARDVLSTERVFAEFSPYVTAKPTDKKKTTAGRREAICEQLSEDHFVMRGNREDPGRLDPRWLDVAVDQENIGMVRALFRPDHARAASFLYQSFDETFRKARALHVCHETLGALVATEHPGATESVCRCLEKFGSEKAFYYDWWFTQMIADLPKSAIAVLEPLVPTLSSRAANAVVTGLQQLRMRQDS
jgi:hypothetical protein